MNPQAPFFGRKISKQGVNVTQATENQLILKEDYDAGDTIYYDDSGIPNVLIGKRPLTGVRGFYVASPGIDVTIATDAQLIFNSSQDIFKIVTSGIATIPAVASTGRSSITVTHNLGFVPSIVGYTVVDGIYGPLPSIVVNLTGTVAYIIDIENLTTTTVDFVTQVNSTAIPSGLSAIPVKYYLLQETAN